MRVFSSCTAILVGTAAALPQYARTTPSSLPISATIDQYEWQAAGEGDLRAPCPGINTLANHGYINRNGRNITVDDFNQGFLMAFGMAYDVSTPGAVNTMNLCTSQQPAGSAPCTSVGIDILDTPHAIEHDGSMRSQDKGINGGTGNNQAYNSTIMGETKNIWGSATHITYQLAQTVRLRRFEEQRAIDDAGWFQENDGGSLSEQAFTLSAMNDPFPVPGDDSDQGYARIEWVEYWYENERLPTDLGWVRPTTTIYQTQIDSITSAMQTVTTLPPTTAISSTTAVSPTTTPSHKPGFPIFPGLPLPTALPFNPYQDVQTPDTWSDLIIEIETFLDSFKN